MYKLRRKGGGEEDKVEFIKREREREEERDWTKKLKAKCYHGLKIELLLGPTSLVDFQGSHIKDGLWVERLHAASIPLACLCWFCFNQFVVKDHNLQYFWLPKNSYDLYLFLLLSQILSYSIIPPSIKVSLYSTDNEMNAFCSLCNQNFERVLNSVSSKLKFKREARVKFSGVKNKPPNLFCFTKVILHQVWRSNTCLLVNVRGVLFWSIIAAKK